MARKSYMADTIEAAYQAWRKCGQNVEMTLRDLARQGYRISKPTIYEWKEKYGWEARAARAEAEERKAADAVVSAEGRAITSLEKVQQRYEKYFETLGEAKVDNQAMFAYTGVVKSITEIKAKTGAFRASLFVDFMRDLIDFLGRHDPDTLTAVEKNFDDFVAYAKEKYGA